MADVDGLEARSIAEDDDAGARVDVDLRRAGPGGADVEQTQAVAVLAADVQDLPTVEGKAGDLDGVAEVATVIADMEVGGGESRADHDVVGEADEAVAGGAVVEQRQQAAVADGRV